MNIFEYANMCENIFRSNLFDYEPKTTFMTDFSIAERFGQLEVKDTYSRAFREWNTDVEYYTELVMVLNHKIWMHWERREMAEKTTKNESAVKYHEAMARLYDSLWKQADAYGSEHFKGADAEYYYRTLD